MKMNSISAAIILIVTFGMASANEELTDEERLDAGFLAYEHEDFVIAYEHFKPLAEQGDAIAQYMLGYMHTFGEGVPRDHLQGTGGEGGKWFWKAACQGDVDAIFMLGYRQELRFSNIRHLFIPYYLIVQRHNEEAKMKVNEILPKMTDVEAYKAKQVLADLGQKLKECMG